MKTHALLILAAMNCRGGPAQPPASGDLPSAGHVRWVQVDADADGRIAKCSVYHDNADDVPVAVRELAERKFPGAAGRYFETELYADEGLVYEVEVQTREGKHCEIAGKADGTELYTECELDRSSVPPKVQSAWTAILPEGELLEAEAKRGPRVDEIDLEVRFGPDLHYLRFKSNGTLIQHLVRMRGSVNPPAGDGGESP